MPIKKIIDKENSIRSQSEINAILLKHAKLHTQKLLTTLPNGSYESLFKSSGLEYHSSREYTFSDDSRHIDWNVSSRLQGLYTKSFLEERERNLWCICDVSASMEIGSPQSLKNLAAEIATTLLLIGYSRNDKIGGIIFSNKIHKVIKAQRSLDVVSKFLSECTADRKNNTQSNLYDTLLYTYRILSQRSLVVVISDFLSDKTQEALTLISRFHDVLVIRVMYDVYKMMPNSGVMKIQDCEEPKKAFISFKKARKEYHAWTEIQERKWASFCRTRKIQKIDITSNESVYTSLQKGLRKRKLR